MEIFKFEIIEKKAVLTEYNGNEKNLVIPEEYNGYPFTLIAGNLFGENGKLIETLVLPKNLTLFRWINPHNLINLRKITFLNEKIEIDGYVFRNLDNLEEVNLFAWKYLSKYQLSNVILKKISFWDTFDSDEQKPILTKIKRSSNIKKNLFLSENADIVAFLIQHKVNVNLESINEYLDYYTKKETTAITAMLLEYRNNKFSKEDIEKTKEENELVEIGLELPTLQQLKQKWNVGKVAGGLRITGYKGDNTTETIPTGTAEGDLIVALGFTLNKIFEPIQTLIIDAKIETLSKKIFMTLNLLNLLNYPIHLKLLIMKLFSVAPT